MGEAAGSMAATIGDCNGDGYDDMLVTRLGYGYSIWGLPMACIRGSDDGLRTGVADRAVCRLGRRFPGFRQCRQIDIFIANGDAHYLVRVESRLLENRGDGTFTDAAAKAALTSGPNFERAAALWPITTTSVAWTSW